MVYKGERKVEVEEQPDPTIKDPLDAVLRITTTNIYGSDLHMYEGRTDVEEGTIFGHENMRDRRGGPSGRHPGQEGQPRLGAV